MQPLTLEGCAHHHDAGASPESAWSDRVVHKQREHHTDNAYVLFQLFGILSLLEIKTSIHQNARANLLTAAGATAAANCTTCSAGTYSSVSGV